MGLTIVDRRTIGVNHFEQVHIAGTESERRCRVEFGLDAHIVSCLYDVLNATLLTETHCDGVDTHGEGLFQRDGGIREAAVGVMRSPGHFLSVLHHFHREVLVLAVVAGGSTLIDGFCIDKELEGGTRLAHSCHLVVFPGVEVDVAHPGLHMSRLWFHCHEATMQESHHVADGVHRGELHLNLALIIVEHLHGVGLVQVVADRVLVTVEFLGEVLIDGQALGDVLDEIRYLLMACILPRVGRAPVLVESLLHLLHLFPCSFFCVFLHAGVERGLDAQACSIKVDTVIAAPILEFVSYCLTEIVGLAVVGILHTIIKFDLELFQ